MLFRSPRLSITIDYSDYKCVKACIHNQGLGPALLKSITYVSEDKKIEIKSEQDYFDLFKSIGIDKLASYLDANIFGDGSPLKEGCEKLLFSLELKEEHDVDKQHERSQLLINIFSKLSYKFVYSDLYNNIDSISDTM